MYWPQQLKNKGASGNKRSETQTYPCPLLLCQEVNCVQVTCFFAADATAELARYLWCQTGHYQGALESRTQHSNRFWECLSLLPSFPWFLFSFPNPSLFFKQTPNSTEVYLRNSTWSTSGNCHLRHSICKQILLMKNIRKIRGKKKKKAS